MDNDLSMIKSITDLFQLKIYVGNSFRGSRWKFVGETRLSAFWPSICLCRQKCIDFVLMEGPVWLLRDYESRSLSGGMNGQVFLNRQNGRDLLETEVEIDNREQKQEIEMYQ